MARVYNLLRVSNFQQLCGSGRICFIFSACYDPPLQLQMASLNTYWQEVPRQQCLLYVKQLNLLVNLQLKSNAYSPRRNQQLFHLKEAKHGELFLHLQADVESGHHLKHNYPKRRQPSTRSSIHSIQPYATGKARPISVSSKPVSCSVNQLR